jgi:hypothetical protein
MIGKRSDELLNLPAASLTHCFVENAATDRLQFSQFPWLATIKFGNRRSLVKRRKPILSCRPEVRRPQDPNDLQLVADQGVKNTGGWFNYSGKPQIIAADFNQNTEVSSGLKGFGGPHIRFLQG